MKKSSETFWKAVNTQGELSASLLRDSQVQVSSSKRKGKNSLKEGTCEIRKYIAECCLISTWKYRYL